MSGDERAGRSALRERLHAVVEISRFNVYRDDLAEVPDDLKVAPLEGLTLHDLNETHISEILLLPGLSKSVEVLQRRFRRGDACIGVRRNGKLVALLWAVFGWLQFGAYHMPIGKDEAYLLDAYVAPDERGHGLGSFVMYQMMERLRSRGCWRIFSVTLRNNPLGLKLRQRMGAVVVDRGFSIKFLNRWRIGSRARPERLRQPGRAS